jgi:uncharacterized protein YndB with AHSA1/START domain
MERENNGAAANELLITRLLNAPRDLVWDAWTNPEHIQHWWGPAGFSNTFFKMDFVPGGVWEFIMHGPDGRDYKNKSVFKEIRKPELISYDHVSGPLFSAVITFEEKGAQTLLTWKMQFESAEFRDKVVKEFGADKGLTQNVDKLESFLANGFAADELLLTRLIKAPRELVYKAWTDKNLLLQWWGPEGFSCPVCEVAVKPGGTIYIDMKGPDGTLYPMDGVYHELIHPEKIVFMSAALDNNKERLFEVMTTVVLEEEEGNTKLTLHAKVSAIKPGGGQHVKGMTAGWSQSLKRLVNLFQ